mgnify:CR=1 FL=1
MDYFSDPIKSTHSRGLADILIKGNKKIFKDFAVQADLHFFYLQDNKPVLSDYLGKELDLSFSYQCAPVMKLIGGISVFNSSKYFCAMQSGNVSDRVPVWAWLTIDFKSWSTLLVVPNCSLEVVRSEHWMVATDKF